MARQAVLQRTLPIRIRRRSRSITIRVFRPTRQRTGDNACTYELASRQLRYNITRRMRGIDGMQAMLLALGVIVIQLERLLDEVGGTIAPALWQDLRQLRPNTG